MDCLKFRCFVDTVQKRKKSQERMAELAFVESFGHERGYEPHQGFQPYFAKERRPSTSKA